MAKIRGNIHRGRTNSKGKAFSVKHNDRNFPFDKSEHIDPNLVIKNIYIKFDVEIDRGTYQKMDDYEQSFYQKNFSVALEKRNERQIANRHRDRVQTMEQFRTNPKYCPEEAIYNIGKFGETVAPETIKAIFEEFVEWHKTHFPNVIFLDAALHLDEPNAAPHIHGRQVWVIKRIDENGQAYLDISQKEALAEMGIERPDPMKKEGKYNNAKMTYTAICREKWIEIAESHGVEIEHEPQDKSLSGATLVQYKARTAENRLKKAEEELDMLNKITDIAKKKLEDIRQPLIEANETIATAEHLKTEIKQLEERRNWLKLAAVEIPPRPTMPPEPPFPKQPNTQYTFTDKAEMREYQRMWDAYRKTVKERPKIIKVYEADCERIAEKQAEWDKLYAPIIAVKKQSEKIAIKEREIIEKERVMKEQLAAMQAQAAAQTERMFGLENENVTLKLQIHEYFQSMAIAIAIRARTLLEKTLGVMGLQLPSEYTIDEQARTAEHILTFEQSKKGR